MIATSNLNHKGITNYATLMVRLFHYYQKLPRSELPEVCDFISARSLIRDSLGATTELLSDPLYKDLRKPPIIYTHTYCTSCDSMWCTAEGTRSLFRGWCTACSYKLPEGIVDIYNTDIDSVYRRHVSNPIAYLLDREERVLQEVFERQLVLKFISTN